MGALNDHASGDLTLGPLVAPDEATGGLLPVLAPLRPLLPPLRPGAALSLAGSASLGLALVAGAKDWTAVVGVPEFGVVAAQAMGADLERLLLVDEPGPRWAEVVAALAEAVRLILLRPPAQPSPTLVRRLTALTRKHGCVLAVAGDWPGATARLTTGSASWQGLSNGHGQLVSRRLQVTSTGRSLGAGRSAWLLCPDARGRLAEAPSPARHLEVVA
ncbi:hypothetical protein [Actinocorallia longicatena]|uniref:Protein RecA n=1 Tax=Actinocorallia longicatena TaxID=111803 RepID=A0ABP6QCA9_9ACTN